MKTVADPGLLRSLRERLGRLRPDSSRQWGTLTPHEMLCHLCDATAMVLGTRPRAVPVPQRHRPLFKALALWAPIPWPHGRPTNPMHDPRAEGTNPLDFTGDLARAIAGIEGLFGTMSPPHHSDLMREVGSVRIAVNSGHQQATTAASNNTPAPIDTRPSDDG
jgi:hypothetical protein